MSRRIFGVLLLFLPQLLSAFLPPGAEVRSRDVLAYRARKLDEYSEAREQHEVQMVRLDQQVRAGLARPPWVQNVRNAAASGMENAQISSERVGSHSWKGRMVGILLLLWIGGITFWVHISTQAKRKSVGK
ncbi:MAG: hypothetical protein AB7E95_08425 [Kiritimatiellales bacterium]